MIYDSEIDKETWAFIEKTKSFYSDELLSYSIEQQRLEYNQMCRAFDTHRQYELIIKQKNGIQFLFEYMNLKIQWVL